MKKIIYILLALVVLLIIAVVIISNYTKQLPNEVKDKSCMSDDDCVIVGKFDPQNPCCNLLCEVESVSKQAEIKRKSWRLENCKGSYISRCPINKCAVPEKLPKPKCVNNRCEIEWVERNSTTQTVLPLSQNISQNVKDICKEKGKIECVGDCVDGFNEYCYFDSTKYKKDELESGFSFPEETRQKCFAIHSFSVCGECFNRFELKKDGEFKEVSCEEFFQAIEDKNKTCNDCINEIWAGCC